MEASICTYLDTSILGCKIGFSNLYFCTEELICTFGHSRILQEAILMNFNVINTIIIVASIQGILFGSHLLCSKKYKSKPYVYLALVVLAISLSNLYYWFIDTGISTLWDKYLLVYVPWDLTILPLFYHFVISYLNINASKAKYLFVPFIIRCFAQVMYVLYLFLIKSWFIIPDSIFKISFYIDKYGTISFFFFMIFLVIKTLVDYNKLPKPNHPHIVNVDIRWLKQLLYLAMGICVVFLFILLLDDLQPGLYDINKYYLVWISLSLIIYWLGYAGVYHLGVFNHRQSIRSGNITETIDVSSIKKSVPPKADRFEFIDNAIKKERLYTDSLISLNTLSEKFGLSEGYISQLINHYAQCNFATYINNLRIEEAKRLLTNTDYKDYTIVSIALESGFNSKSAFYTVFKKNTNLSPTEYKKQNS